MRKSKLVVIVSLLTLSIIAAIILAIVFGRQEDTAVPPNEVESFKSLSDSELEEILASERNSIIESIDTRFTAFSPNYTIKKLKLMGSGQYCGAVLRYSSISDSNRYDTYRLILHKSNDMWQTVGIPELVLSYQSYPDIPKEVVSLVNAMAQ